MIPENVLDPVLYRKAVKKVTQSYGTQTSAYRSMAIVKAYKAMGGKYKIEKQNRNHAMAQRTVDPNNSVLAAQRNQGVIVRPTQARVSTVRARVQRHADHGKGNRQAARQKRRQKTRYAQKT